MESGIYTALLSNAAGCDSTVTLVLTVSPASETSVSASICAGETYLFNGEPLTESGTYTALLTNSAGCDSTVTLSLSVLPNLQTAVNASICAGESYPFAGQLLTDPGIYSAVYAGSNGCDSTVTLTLSVITVNVTVTAQGNTLTATVNGPASFQWIDCSNNQPIAGATGSTYTPAVSGSYAVVATQNGCSVTSTCVTVTIVSSPELAADLRWDLYPNPATSQVWVRVGDASLNQLQAEIYDVTGRLCLRQTLAGESTHIDLSGFDSGMFWVRLINGAQATETKRLMVVRR